MVYASIFEYTNWREYVAANPPIINSPEYLALMDTVEQPFICVGVDNVRHGILLVALR